MVAKNLLKYFCQSFEKILLEVTNYKEDHLYSFNFKKNGFSPNVSLEPQIAFLTSLPKSLHQKMNRFLRIESREDEEKCTFFRKDPQNFPLETSNAVLTSLPKVFRQKLDNFSRIFRRW